MLNEVNSLKFNLHEKCEISCLIKNLLDNYIVKLSHKRKSNIQEASFFIKDLIITFYNGNQIVIQIMMQIFLNF